MATVEKMAVINVDPEVQAAIDRVSRGGPRSRFHASGCGTHGPGCAKKCERRRECESGRPVDPRNPG